MTWIYVAIGLAVVGTGVLVLAGVKVMAAARALSREITQANSRISPAEQRLHSQIGMNNAAEG